MAALSPYYEDASCVIYNADCRDVLPTLGPVDLVLTDPPYGMGYVTARRSRSHPLVAPIEGDDDLNALRDALPLLDAILRPDRHAYVFAAPTLIGDAVAAVSEWWAVKNLLVWDKGNAGSVGDLEAGYGVNWEGIVYASKGRRNLNGPRPRCIYRHDWSGTRDPVHPTVKPVSLLSWLLAKSTELGEVVLDPFMGSGTTLRAARDLGRKSIGVEVEERYCEAAVNRLAQMSMDLEGV